MNLEKNSFTILETLISISLLLFVISGFSNFTYYSSKSNNFQTLNTLENKFTKKDYSSFSKNMKNLEIQINNSLKINLNVEKYEYKDEKITLFKYEI